MRLPRSGIKPHCFSRLAIRQVYFWTPGRVPLALGIGCHSALSLRVNSFSPEVTMRKVQLALVVAFSLLLLCGLNAFAANTYYIDCAGGSIPTTA